MLKAEEKAGETYFFSGPPNPESIEWAGKIIGKSNTITKTKSRTAVYDKTIDEKPGRREELMDAVTQHLATLGKKEEIFIHDVVIHGIRVRATTNSLHLAQYWKENWYSVPDWKKYSGQNAPEKPQVWVYALGGVAGQPEAAYYSHAGNTVIFFNTAYYGQLKSWVLGAVGRVLADEYGIHSIHGASVEKGGKGVLYIAPTGTGKSTSSYGLMDYPNTRFHSDDWVYIRYAFTTKDGRKVSPYRIRPKAGAEIKGYRCFRWLENHANEEAAIRALTLDHHEVELSTSQIDFSKPVEAYGYVSEKVFYLRCNLVESFPKSAYSILQADLENVPDVSDAFRETHADALESGLKAVRENPLEAARKYFEKYSDSQAKDILARLSAFDNARALLDITKVFDPKQVFINPLEPVKLSAIMLLKRNFKEESVLDSLTEERFMERLLIGETPQGKREVAYNAYRAVDEAAEFAFIDIIEKASKAANKPLYQLYQQHQDEIPPSLLEEFELFRTMFKSCACYDLNTVLQKDPKIPNRREAVEMTMKVIAEAIETKDSGSVHYNISNYRQFIRS